MECPPHRLVPSEGESDVGDAATDLATWADLLDLTTRLKEIHRVVVVLAHASANRQDVRVKDDVLRIEPNVLHQDLESPLADPHLYNRRLLYSLAFL